MSIQAFTICSANYLAQAITLGDSLREHGPDWKFTIVLVDDPGSIRDVPIPRWISILPAEDIGIPEFQAMALRYNIIELSTAIKPFCFVWFFSQDTASEQVHYVDPDMMFFNDPEPLFRGLKEADMLLTPHHFSEIPHDNKFPRENLALNHGIYNLGYLGLRRTKSTDEMLSWWSSRLHSHCIIDLKEGYFVDQLWMNFVPIYYPGADICRHPGINIAYWNLHERTVLNDRELSYRGESWPLVLFHFSGFRPASPDRLTRADIRVGPREQPALVPMLEDYAKRLLANGYERLSLIESTYVSANRQAAEARKREFAKRHPMILLSRRLRQMVPEKLKLLLRA
jgi:hypothetical protein